MSRPLWIVFVAMLLAVLLALGQQELDSRHASTAQTRDAASWGAEAVQVFKEHAQTFSPIALANACGLGASSCARCHSGRRAEAPHSDPETAPWHHDHRSVNYSCVGCHQGNARVMREDVAHRGLIAHPLADAQKNCTSCHAAAGLADLATRYPLARPLSPEHPPLN